VNLEASAMNKGDCFILDAGKEIFLYVGQKSKRIERLKAISAANQIRDQDHAGRTPVHIIGMLKGCADTSNITLSYI
jgi:gelsolin